MHGELSRTRLNVHWSISTVVVQTAPLASRYATFTRNTRLVPTVSFSCQSTISAGMEKGRLVDELAQPVRRIDALINRAVENRT
jgi:hypothetical protein